jgi:TatD DNase family protein
VGLIDSHAHLTCPELKSQVEEVLERAVEAGVDRIITVGMDLDDAKDCLRLCERYPNRVRAVVGFHPHEAMKVTDDDLAAMSELLDHPSIVGFGEMGLDYHYDFSPPEVQQRVFAKQLTMAADRGLPVVVHSREAFQDTARLLVQHGFDRRPVVFHCFTGSAEEAGIAAGHGWRLSFVGIVTFRNSRWLQEIARDYPADQLMIETDSPYLSPEPVRSKRPNEPAFIVHTARFLAELRGTSFGRFVEQTSRNTLDFYRHPLNLGEIG